MRVIFESSFLQDLRRIDNIIELNRYSYSEEGGIVYNSALAILERDTMNLKISLNDDADKSNVSVISFYYKLKGIEGDSRLAFLIYLDSSVLDPTKNLFEIPLDFERTIYNEATEFTPTTEITIPGKVFEVEENDKIVIYCDELLGERNIKIISSSKVLFNGLTPNKITLDYSEIINQRGLKITGYGFTLEKIKLSLENPVRANIDCPALSEDNKFLLRPLEYGTSLYKNFKILDTKLIWKDSYQKYSNTEGLNSKSDAKILESREGKLTTPPRYIRSYSNLKFYVQGMNLDGYNEIINIKEDHLDSIPVGVYHCWDSPMIDGVQTSETPNCIYKCGEFLNPNEVFYGNPNTHYLQYLNITNSSIYAIQIYGLPKSVIEFRFNKDSEKGVYIEKRIELDENGSGKLELTGLGDFIHLNNIRTITTNKVSGIYFVTLVDAEKINFVPTGDGNIYMKEVSIDTEYLDFHGTCDYIEYEIKEDKITEHSRGSISIESIPEINIEMVEFGELGYTIDRLLKRINLSTPITSGTIPYATFRLSIDNNYVFDGSELVTEKLISDIDIKVRQLIEIDVYWKLNTTPDYYEQEKGLFILENQTSARRTIYLETNDPNILMYRDQLKIDTDNTDQETLDTFEIYIDTINTIYRDSKYLVPVIVVPKNINESPTWIPDISGIPGLLGFTYRDNVLSGCQLYLVQRPTTGRLQVWDCITGDSYSSCYVDTSDEYRIELTPSETFRKFIVVTDNSSLDSANWYHIKSSSTDFEIRQNDVTPDIKTRGKIVYDAYGTGVIHLSDSNARNYLFCDVEVSEDKEIGTFEISTSSVSSGWRSIVVSNTVTVSVFRTATENQFSATPLSVNGIGTYTSEIYTNFRFRVSCSESSGIRIFSDSNTLATDDYYTDLPYDGYFMIRFAVTKWPITIPDDEYLIKIYSTDSDIEFSGIEVIAESSDLIQSYIDSDQTIPRRLFFLENDNSVSNSLETDIISNKTPTLSFSENSHSSGITGFKENPIFTGYTYRKHNIKFNITRPSESGVYNEYYPISNFASLITNKTEYGGLAFYTYVKGLTNRIWMDDITEYSGNERDILIQAINNKKNTEFNVYFNYSVGSEKIIRVFSRYITANGSIWKFEDSGFSMVGNEHMRLESSTDWTTFTYNDSDFTRYYRDYKMVTLQENSGDSAIYVGSVTVISMVNYDNLDNDVANYLINPLDGIVAEERIDVNYAKNNILPTSFENIKINFYQLGKNDNIVIEDIDPFNAVGGRKQIAVSRGAGVSITSAIPSGIENCSVECQVESGGLSLSAITYPRRNIGICTSNFENIISDIKSRVVKFIINVTYTDSISVTRNYEKLIETTQGGYSQILMLRKSSGISYYAIGPSTDNTIDFGNISTAGETVNILCGIVNVNTSGPIDGSYIKTPDLVWTKNSAPYSFESPRYSYDALNLTIEFPSRDAGDMETKEYIFSLSDPDERFNTTGYKVKFTQGSIDYFAEFEYTEADILSDGTVMGNNGFLYFNTNIQEDKIKDIVFESDSMEIVEWENPIKVDEERYGVKIWFTPNGSGNFNTGNLKINYLDRILDTISVKQGYFSLQLKPYEASYSLIPIEKERVYRDLDLHNFTATDESVDYDSTLSEPVMIVSDNDEDLGISILLDSNVSGGNLFYSTKQNVDMITIINYKGDGNDYITESSGKNHLVSLDPLKKIKTVEILAKAGWTAEPELTVTFEKLELNYEPSLSINDFELPTGSTSTWEGGVLYVTEGTDSLIFKSPEYLDYFGNKLTITTDELVSFNINVKYRDGIIDSIEETTALSTHSILLNERKLIDQISLENLAGTITFTGLQLDKTVVTLSLSNFEAIGDEAYWDNSRFIFRSSETSDYLEINLGSDSKYEGVYSDSQIYLETSEKSKLHVVVEYTESNEITNYVDSSFTQFHHIRIPALTRIGNIKIYNTEVGRVQFTKDIQIDPTEYRAEIISETNLDDPNLEIVYASTSETENLSSQTYRVPCKTEKDNGSSIEKVTRKIYYPDLYLQEPNDDERVNLRNEGLVEGNWTLEEVTWINNSGKTLVSEFFDSYGGILMTESLENDYVYSKNIPYFEGTYITKEEYIPFYITASVIFKVNIKNTNSRHDYQHLGIGGIQTFRFGFKLEKAAERLT